MRNSTQEGHFQGRTQHLSGTLIVVGVLVIGWMLWSHGITQSIVTPDLSDSSIGTVQAGTTDETAAGFGDDMPKTAGQWSSKIVDGDDDDGENKSDYPLVDTWGDNNADSLVTAVDLQRLAEYLAGILDFDPEAQAASDLDLDSLIDAVDLAILINFLSGNIAVLPHPSQSPGDCTYISPEDETAFLTGTSVVTLQWSEAARTEYYEVYFGSEFDPPLLDTTDATEYAVTVADLETYYWGICAVNNLGVNCSSDDIWVFTIGNKPDDFDQLTPADESNFFTGTTAVILEWDSARFAEYYDVYFGTTATPPLVGDNIPGTSYEVTVTDYNLYYWTVCAINSNGQKCSYSGTWSFVVGLQPDPFNLQTPADESIFLTGTTAVNLEWDSAPYADYYDVYFGTSTTPPLVGDNIVGTSYEVTVSNQLYYWTVCAVNSNGQTCTQSGTWSFVVGLIPFSFDLQTPADKSNFFSGTTAVNLEWDSAPFADYYDVYFGTTATPPLVGDNIPATSYEATVDDYNLYYWTVYAVNSNGHRCTQSGTWSFVVGLQPDQFDLQTPADE